jgi:hypothetical protein
MIVQFTSRVSKSHPECQNHTQGARHHKHDVEIKLLGVVITFGRVKITIRVEFTLVRVVITLVSVIFTHIRVKITLV